MPLGGVVTSGCERLALTNARGADPLRTGVPVPPNFDFLQVRVLPGFGDPGRLTTDAAFTLRFTRLNELVADNRTLAANCTYLCHLQTAFNRRYLKPGTVPVRVNLESLAQLSRSRQE